MEKQTRLLMVGVDKTSIGGMRTVVENYLGNSDFVESTHLTYIASVINSSIPIKIIFFLTSFVKIICTIVFKRKNIVHIHMAERTSVYREGVIAKSAKLLGCRVIIHMHGADIETWYRQLPPKKKTIAKYFMNSADIMIVLGKNWIPFISSIVNENKIRVVYNSVYQEPQRLYNEDAKDIIFLGMVIPRKGIVDLLDAFKKVIDEIPADIKLKIYGSDKNNNIDMLIAERNLESRAYFCGWLTSDKKNDCFATTMINVLPSYNEGLPMTILETMAYGIPNISTRIAAIPEVIRNGENGILITPGDVETLAESIKRLTKDTMMRHSMSVKSYDTIKKNYIVQGHLENILNIYKSVL